MKLNVKLVDKIIGLFILIAIIGMVVLLVFLGLNQRWFKKNYYFKSEFQTAKNLSPGMSIRLKGFEIGKVDKIGLDPESKIVNMTFYIYEEYYANVVFKNSIIELVSNPIGLGNELVFHPGMDTSLLEPVGTLIPSYSSEEGMQRVSMGLVDRAQSDDSIGSLLAQVNPILQQIPPVLFSAKTLMQELNQALKGTRTSQLGLILIGVNKTLDGIQGTLQNVDSILKGTNTGPIGVTLNNVSSFSGNLNKVMQNVNSTLGQVNKIIDQVNTTLVHEMDNIDKLIVDLKGTTGNIEKLTADPTGLAIRLIDPKGSLKTLLDDGNKLYNTITTNLDSMLLKVNQIIGRLDEFVKFVTGTAPQISGLLEEGKEALNTGQDVLEGLKNNPLLKGGITEKRVQPGTFNSYRDEEF